MPIAGFDSQVQLHPDLNSGLLTKYKPVKRDIYFWWKGVRVSLEVARDLSNAKKADLLKYYKKYKHQGLNKYLEERGQL